MKRRLLNLLTAFSLLLCVAVIALWVRSYRRSDWITHRTLSRRDIAPVEGENQRPFIVRAADFDVRTGSGNVRVSRRTNGWYDQYDYSSDTLPSPGWAWATDEVDDPAGEGSHALWSRLGFDFDHSLSNGVFQTRVTTVCLPLWTPAVLLAAPATLWALRRFPARTPTSRCPACGYDLTGNASGVCPECGNTR
jgi:hypothetical protein